MTEEEKKYFYTLQEVADILGVSRQTIYNYKTAGKLRAYKIGHDYRVSQQDLREFLAERRI